MENFQNITWELRDTFQEFATTIAPFLLKIAAASVLIIIGWVAGKMLKKLIRKIARKTDIDGLLRKIEFDVLIEKMGYKLNSGKFLGGIARWLVFLGFFVVAMEILGLTAVTGFMFTVLGSVMNIVVAIIIFVVAVFVSRFVRKLAQGSAQAMKIKADQFIGNIAAAVVYFSAIVTILGLFEVTAILLKFIGIIVMGAVAGLALAFGLAFGLGGKERAAEIIKNMKN